MTTLWGWPGQNPLRWDDPSGHFGKLICEKGHWRIKYPVMFNGAAPAELKGAIGDALARFSNALNVPIDLEEVGQGFPYRDGLNVFNVVPKGQVGGGEAFGGVEDTALGHITKVTYEDSSELWLGDPWAPTGPHAWINKLLVAHEVGHSLGQLHHLDLPDGSPIPGHVMSFYPVAGNAIGDADVEEIASSLGLAPDRAGRGCNCK
jgi:hypothetical protein